MDKKILVIPIILTLLFVSGFKGQYEYRKQIDFSEMLEIKHPVLINGGKGFNLSNETNIINYNCLAEPTEYLFLYYNDKGDFTFRKCGTGFFGWLCKLTKGRYFLTNTKVEIMNKLVYNKFSAYIVANESIIMGMETEPKKQDEDKE